MSFTDPETYDVVGNTAEDWRRWRASTTPVYDAAHVVLEAVLIIGWAIRFLCHVAGHGIYRDSVHGDSGGYDDEMFGFDHLVGPVLEPEHWHQEALMRGFSCVFGLVFISMAASMSTGPFVSTPTHMVVLTYAARMLIGGYLVLDPVFGVAWRIATGDS